MTPRVVAVFLLSTTAAAAFSVEQQTRPVAPPQVIASRTTAVPIEVRVLTRAGQPVTDLTPSDFVVLEDDVPQRIEHFGVFSSDAPGNRPADALTYGRTEVEKAPRTFLVMLGRGRLEAPSRGLTSLKAFVKNQLGADDRIGIMAYGRATDFTTDHGAILRLLERYEQHHTGIEAGLDLWFSGLREMFGSRELSASLKRDIATLFAAQGLPPLREVPIATTAGDEEFHRVNRDAFQQSEPFTRDEGPEKRGYVTEAVRQDFAHLYAAVQYAGLADGEKHLLYVTEEILVFGARPLEWLSDLANDARVTISVVQTGGVPVAHWNTRGRRPIFYGPSITNLFAQGDLQRLAARTGGLASIFSDADKGLNRINDLSRFHYVLGYYPTTTARDGKYHRLTVKTHRPGLDVRHRQGFFARDRPAPDRSREGMSVYRIMAAATYWRSIEDIRLTFKTPTVEAAAGAAQISVDLSIAPETLTFTRHEERHHASLDVALFAINSSEALVGEVWKKVELALDDATLQRVQAEGLPLQLIVPLKTSATLLRAVVYQHSVDRLGSADTKVR